MAIDFPASPAQGQIFRAYPGLSFVYRGSGWAKTPMATALPKNYVVNPSMLINQQFGGADTGSPNVAALDPFYPADQWITRWNVAGATFFGARWTPGISVGNTIYIRTTTAKGAAIGAGDYVLISTFIEAQRIAEWQWGTPNAKDIVLKFGLVVGSLGAAAGLYSFRLSNHDQTRTYIGTFSVVGAWQDYEFAIPGDTVGTWAKDNGIGLRLEFVAGIGSNYHGVLGWQSGSYFYAVPGQANVVNQLNLDFHIYTVGLYLDPYKTGKAPLFEHPEFGAEMRRCQRYWYKQFSMRGCIASGTVIARGGAPHPVPMRITPVGSVVGTPRIWDGTTSAVITSLTTACNEYAAEFDITTGGTFTAGGRGAAQYYQDDTHYLAMSARM